MSRELLLTTKLTNATISTPGNEGRLTSINSVVGISLTGSKTMWEHSYRPDGTENEESISADDDQIVENIADFFERTKAKHPQERPFHNCHSFGWYALGVINDLVRYEGYDADGFERVNPHELKSGELYTVFGNTAVHSLLGVDNPTRSLSVLGDNSALATMDTASLLRAYGGDQLLKLNPKSAHF